MSKHITVYDKYVIDYSSRTYTENGFLMVPSYVSRIGVQQYTSKEIGLSGKNRVVNVLRRPEDVFDPISMATFKTAVLTNNHPQKPVTSENAKDLAIGFIDGDVKVASDNTRLFANLIITDAHTIKEIEHGKSQLSVGYSNVLESIDTEWDGIKCEYAQTNIRANHVAIVKRGRGGIGCSISDDADELIKLLEETNLKPELDKDGNPVIAVVVDDEVKPELDADGNPIIPVVDGELGADGNPVITVVVDDEVKPELDADGNPIIPVVDGELDADGNLIIVIDCSEELTFGDIQVKRGDFGDTVYDTIRRIYDIYMGKCQECESIYMDYSTTKEELESHKSKLNSTSDELNGLKARYKSLSDEMEIVRQKTGIEAALLPDSVCDANSLQLFIDEAVSERLELMTIIDKLSIDVDFKGKSTIDIKREVVVGHFPNIDETKLTSDQYVEARFDAIIDMTHDGKVSDTLRKALSMQANDTVIVKVPEVDRVEKARQEFILRNKK